ncbi:hypothetical protein BYT27DRAFT_7124036 [Phlegmacium glaucopus]|nr:hypothetical protein BYT27DRAFT_7124036 [Phlegmacium glaucopus]
MVSAARTWALFKIIRILIFALSTIACMVWTAFYTFLLIRGWSSFLVDQRAIILVLISIYGISSIILYLMIVVIFRPWMDGARVAFLVLFQVGGTVTFFIFRPSFPCHNIGTQSTCRAVEDIVIFGGWSLSGLLLIYGFFLAIMSYVPVPTPPPNPEAALAINLGNDSFLEKEKRRSSISVDSHYSQPSFIEPATPVPSIHYPNDSTRAPFVRSPDRMGYNYNYRSGTPGSVRSTITTTSRSSTQGSTSSRHDYFYPSRVPTPASSIRSPLLPNARSPHPPVSRQGTPQSVVSYQGPLATNGRYNQQHPSSLTPSALIPGDRQLLTYDPNVVPPPLVQPFSATLSLRSAPQGTRPTRMEGSVHMSSRSGSVSSVPRSPSPQNLSFNAPIPAAPMAAVLPAHPRLPMSPYNRNRGVNEVRRYGSVPNVRAAPNHADSHYRNTSDGAVINNVVVRGNNGQHANIQQWRRN